MTTNEIRLIYDGPAMRGHAMDISDLAPALLALGDLCREANRAMNDDRAGVKVLVHSDFERGCFQISFEIVQTLYEQVRDLIRDRNLVDANGLVDLLLAGATAGLIAFLKMRKGRPVASEKNIRSSDRRSAVEVKFKGDNNTVVISPHVNALSKDQRVVAAVKGILRPLQNEGIEIAEFRWDGQTQVTVDKGDAKDIIDTAVSDEDSEIEPQEVIARLRIHTLSFDTSSSKWKFWYGGDTITADVSRTSIVRDAIRRGHVDIDDGYKVVMEIQERKTKRGFVNDYTIVRVLDFVPGKRQDELNFPTDTQER